MAPRHSQALAIINALRKFHLSLLIISFIWSCGERYFYRYEIENKTDQDVLVEIQTTGSPYQDVLFFEINPGDTKSVFEHKPYGKNIGQWPLSRLDAPCIYIKSMKISNGNNMVAVKDFFCDDCSEFETLEGSIGKYATYTLRLSPTDFQ